MNCNMEKCIDFVYGEYKNGLFGKKYNICLSVYPSSIEGKGILFYNNELSKDTFSFEISYSDILKMYIGEVSKQTALFIEYNSQSVVSNKKSTLVLLGIDKIRERADLIEETKKRFIEKKIIKQRLELQRKEEQHRLAVETEEKASKFFGECYSFHVKDNTPVYQLFSDKNRVALIYIDANKALNFLKIDGYEQEENNGVIAYENIHYYEKAGSVSYTTDIRGEFSSFGGSIVGGNVSKLATIGGGLLFGPMGLALGAALTYKPIEQKQTNTTFSVESDIRKIDDRSVILNYYSDIKKQYIDIELPQDIYNFLQTYLPEKKYGIVHELEKKTVVHQSTAIIENGEFLKVPVKAEVQSIELKEASQTNSIEDFKLKVEKLKMMRDAGLLSEQKFEEEQARLLSMI